MVVRVAGMVALNDAALAVFRADCKRARFRVQCPQEAPRVLLLRPHVVFRPHPSNREAPAQRLVAALAVACPFSARCTDAPSCGSLCGRSCRSPGCDLGVICWARVSILRCRSFFPWTSQLYLCALSFVKKKI